MSRSYRNGDIPKFITEQRNCTLKTLRAIKDALCEAGYTPFSIKNEEKCCKRKSIHKIKRMGKRLELDRSFRFDSAK